MTTPAPFGLELPTFDIGQWVVRILAVAGAAALGGLLVGLITQGLSRLMTTRPVPRVPLQIVRLLGAIVCGWLVALLLFYGLGGTGGGSGGGEGPGQGPGKGSAKEEHGATGREADTARESTPRDTSKETPLEAGMVQIEVLPENDAYSVKMPGGRPLRRNFDELTDDLLKAKPPVTGIRVYRGSSKPDAPAVVRIRKWATAAGLHVDIPPKPRP
jgi:hypothetical protein